MPEVWMHRERPLRNARLVPLGLAALCLVLTALPGPARAEGESLESLELCADVQDRRGVDCGVAFPADVGQVHAMLAVMVPPGKRGAVSTVWRFGDRVMQKQTLTIRFHRTGGYRTRSRQRISRSLPGAWSVEVQDSAGKTLIKQDFSVGPVANDGRSAAPETPPLDAGEAPAAADMQVPDTDGGATADGGPGADGGEAPAADATVFVLDGGAADAAGTRDAGATRADAGPPEATAAGTTLADAAKEDPPTPTAAPEGDPAEADGGLDADNRRRGGLLLLVGGLLLLVAGVLIARRRAGRARAASAADPPEPPDAPAPGAATPPRGTPTTTTTATAPPAAAPAGSDAAATDALQRLTDLVTHLWSRWVAATSGSPQRALNAAWRAIPDPGRLSLDHIRLCNGLESAARDYSAIPPRGSSRDILRLRMYAQAPALIGVICALAVEVERLDLQGVRLEEAFGPWGGRAGLTAELLSILDDGAKALGTTRLALLPYETKATTAHREFEVELKPFPLPAAVADRIAAGNRIVRVETPPFADGPRPVVWGISPG